MLQENKIVVISENWQFRRAGTEKWFPAKVPGTVHTDLKENGLISNPFYRHNERQIQWVEEENWEYRTVFQADKMMLENDVVELHFDGLDTYADVYLNDILILRAENMFLARKISCKPYLQIGNNELRIFFHSPVKMGMEKMKAFWHKVPAPNELAPEEKRTSPFTRKAPFHYGWDWGPRLVTSGIWRRVMLSAWSFARIEDVFITTETIENEKAEIKAHVEINAVKAGHYVVSLLLNGEEIKSEKIEIPVAGLHKTTFETTIKNPRLWWPNGIGEAYLYNVEVALLNDQKKIHSKCLKHGIRTVKLLQNPDEHGNTFYFEVNNVPVFMKGANIIPPEVLTPEATDETYQKLIRSAIDANMNMLRVWGGGIYLDDIFYDLCSAGGLLVWHDFMFACALQPGDEAHLNNISLEAVYNVKRFRNQACLAMWCGNNENLIGWHKWGWKEMFEPSVQDKVWATYFKIFHEILPRVVNKFDPKTAYRATSPATIDYRLPDRKSGDEHDWTVWFGQKPIASFWEHVPRFASEWGLQSFPEMGTIRTFAEKEDLNISSEVMRHRQRSRMDWLKPGFDGNQMISWYVDEYFDKPKDFVELVEKSQLLQALACKTAIEAHRTAMPHCMGSLFWQLNDCWPTVSWATVDYYFRWKIAHYAVKNAFEPVIVAAREVSGKVQVFVVSDKFNPFLALLRIAIVDFGGAKLFAFEKEISVAPNTSEMIFEKDLSDVLPADYQKNSLLSMKLLSNHQTIARNWFLFAKPKELHLPENSLDFLKSLLINGH